MARTALPVRKAVLWLALLITGSAAGSPSFQAAPTVLFVANATNLGAADSAVRTRLQNMGYTVTVKKDTTVITGDATGKALVIISSTVGPANVNTKFKAVTVPVLLWESEVLDDMAMTGPTLGTDYGTTTGQSAVAIATPAHAMAAGLTGSPAVVSSNQTFSWGVPNANAVKIATLTGNAGRSVIFGYDTGASMVGYTAPGRRTGFFLHDTTSTAWNTNGQALFDAAVRWSTNSPNAPTDLTAAPGSTQVQLNWTAVSGATSYNVKRSTTSGGPYASVGTSATTTFTNTGLTNGTAYYYVVSAMNSGGISADSAQVACTPGAPGVPTGLTAVPGVGQVQLNWTAVFGATSYNVKRSTTNGGPYSTVGTPAANSFLDTTVTNGQTYYYVVSAVNGAGQSANSSQVTATPAPPPTAPTGVAAAPGDGQVVLTWNAVSGATSYFVKRLSANGASYEIAGSGVTATTFTDVGRANGTPYFYVVSATNGQEGPASSQVSATPFGIPTGLVAVAGSANVALSWSVAPGALAYNVKRGTSGSGPFTTIAPAIAQTTYTNTGLSNGTTYYYVVSSQSGAVESANSAVASATPVDPPTTPTGLSAVAGTGQVVLAWTAVSGAASYTVKRSLTSGSGYVAVASGLTSPTVTNLSVTNGVPHYYVVTAVNAGGESGASSQVSATPMSAPSGLTATGANGQIVLTWAGVTGATSYSVKRSTASAGPFSPVGAPAAPPFTDPGLTNGTVYYYVVSAVNGSGESGNSGLAAAAPLAPPTAPGGVTATGGLFKISVMWNPVQGAASYTVRRSATAGGPYTVIATNITAPAYANTGLPATTAYYYVVSAVNASGESPNSAEVSGTTQALTPPAVPQMTAPVVLSPTSIRWNWTAILNADSYAVHDAGENPLTSVTGPSYQEEALLENTQYTRHVHSVGEGGASAASNSIPTYTLVHQPTTADFTAAASGNQGIIDVTPPPNNTGLTGVQIERSTDLLNWSVAKGMSSVYTCTDPNLLGATTYHYRVIFRSAGNVWTLPSLHRTITTAAVVPPAPTLSATAQSPTSILWTWTNVAGETRYELHDASHAVIGSPDYDVNYFLETGLENTKYTRHVHAYNGAGEGNASATVPKYTLVAPPDLNDLSPAAASPTQINVTFTAPPNNGMDQTWTAIESCTDGVSFGVIAYTTQPSPFLHQNLIPGTTYYYRISYRNGDGAWSAVSPVKSVATQAGAPNVPGLSVAAVGPTWIRWAFGAVSGETEYVLHDNAHNVVGSTTTDVLTFTETVNILENTSYQRHLHAKQGTFESAASGTITAWTSVRDPIANDFSLSAPSGTQVQITVTPPVNNSGVAPTGINLQRATDAVSWTGVTVSAGQYGPTDTLPIPGAKTWYRFRYVNGGGTPTAWSPAKSIQPPAAAPAAPASLSGVASRSDAILWSWSNVAGESSFQLHDNANDQLKATIGQDNLSILETGLLENTTYTRHVHAYIGATPSPASPVATQTTFVHTPIANDITLTQLSPTQIRIQVNPPLNPTSPLTGCQIEYSTNLTSWNVVSSMSPNYDVTHTVVSGTQYFYRIYYRSSGNVTTVVSPWKSLQAAPAPGAAPPAPTGFNSGLITTSSIYWFWNDVTTESSYIFHDAAHAAKAGSPLGQGVTYVNETGLGENEAVTRHVYASNTAGTSAATGSLTRYTLIHDPLITEFTVTAMTANQVKVTVTSPPNRANPNTGFWIERSADNTNMAAQWFIPNPANATYDHFDNGVQSNFTYYYRIRYRNGGVVDGPWSPVRNVTTPAVAPAAPAGFAGTAESLTSIKWTWGDVWDETSYELRDGSNVTIPPALGADILTVTETGLLENSSYVRRIHAINGSGNTPSNQVTRWTKVRTPTAPTLSGVTSTEITVSLPMPPNGNQSSSGCIFERSLDMTTWTQVQGWTSSYSQVDSNRTPGTTYYYRAQFRNGDGQQVTPYSPIASATTLTAIPTAPTTFSGTVVSTNAVAWAWSNVAGETFFDLHTGGEGPVTSLDYDVLSYLETGLFENTPYTRHVHARNGLGSSVASPSVTKYTRVREPLGTDISVSALNPTTARVQVTPAANPQLAPLTGCAIDRSVDGVNWGQVKGYDQNYLWDNINLTPGTTYYYRVWYRNGDALATVNASPAVSVALPPAAPSAPVSFQYSFDSSTSIQWKWTEPSGTVTGYVLHDENETPPKAVISGHATEYTETNLQPNTQYTRHLHATNSAGPGAASNSSTGSTTVATPTIASFTVTPVTSTSILITVVPPPNSTLLNTGVEIQRYVDGNWSVLGAVSQSYTQTDVTLTPGVTYGYRIRFRDLSGLNYTPFSPVQTAATPLSDPGIPGNFRIQATTTSSITWAWDDVTGELGYELHDDSGAVKATLAPEILTALESGLAENAAYPRHIHTKITGGLSDPSSSLTGATLVHSATTADFMVQAVSPTRIDVIVFSPPNPAEGQTGCEIQRSPDGTAWSTLKAYSAVYGASDTGLTPDQTYYYRIQFRNRDGVVNPGYSTAVAVATAAPAAPATFAGAGQSTSTILWTWSDVPGETGFRLHDSTHSVVNVPGPGVLSFLESGLAENIKFTRHVHAVNGIGTGPESVAGSAYTRVHDAMTSEIRLKAVSTTQIDITVTAPPNGSSDLTGCEIQRSPDGSAWTTIKAFSASYGFSDQNLAPVTTYYYRIRFQNGDGLPSGYSPAKSTITVPQPVITTPDKKIRSQAIAVQGTVTAGVSSVRVYFNTVDQGTATLNGSAWNFTSANKPEGSYVITARAFIGATPSDESASITIQVDLTAPAAPTNIRTTAYNNAIDIEWDPSPSLDVVGYRVQRKTGPGGTWATLNTTGEVAGTKYRDTTAVNGTTYFYRVIAVDDALPN